MVGKKGLKFGIKNIKHLPIVAMEEKRAICDSFNRLSVFILKILYKTANVQNKVKIIYKFFIFLPSTSTDFLTFYNVLKI